MMQFKIMSSFINKTRQTWYLTLKNTWKCVKTFMKTFQNALKDLNTLRARVRYIHTLISAKTSNFSCLTNALAPGRVFWYFYQAGRVFWYFYQVCRAYRNREIPAQSHVRISCFFRTAWINLALTVLMARRRKYICFKNHSVQM